MARRPRRLALAPAGRKIFICDGRNVKVKRQSVGECPLITPSALDYFEQLPALPDDMGLAQADESIAQMKLAMDIFPDFVALIEALRASTLIPGSPLSGKHEDLTERWVAMLTKSLMESGSHLERLIPLAAKLVSAEIADPVQTSGISLADQLKEITNPNSNIRQWSTAPDHVDLASGAIHIDSAEVIFPGVLQTKFNALVKKNNDSENFFKLCNVALAQKSAAYTAIKPVLGDVVGASRLDYDHPTRMAVLGPSVDAVEFGIRFNRLLSSYAFPNALVDLQDYDLQKIDADDALEASVRDNVRSFKVILDNALVSKETITIDLYAGLREGMAKTLKYNDDESYYIGDIGNMVDITKLKLSSFINEIGNIGVDSGMIATAILRGSWGAGIVPDCDYRKFVQISVSYVHDPDQGEWFAPLLHKEFLMRAPEDRLLRLELPDSSWSCLYKLRRSTAFLERIKSAGALESVLSNDLGL